MLLDEWAHALLEELDDGDGAHDIAHVKRVVQVARQIDCALDGACDHEVLSAAAWLHDLVSVAKDSPQRSRASLLSADQAVVRLRALGFPKPKLAAVHHAIQAHSFSASLTPETIEAKVLQDADRLDALGAIGLARCFYTAGRMDAALFHPADPLGTARPLDDRAYALDHLPLKLFRIAETLHTDPARAIAGQRVAFLRSFVAQLMEEAG